MRIKTKLSAWYQASRPPFFIATLIPLGVGGRLAAIDGHWNGWLWGAIILASFFVHLSTNLANDYFEIDNDSQADSIGGTRVLQQGLITIKEMKFAIIALYAFAFFLGLTIFNHSRSWILIVYILFAALSSLYYTAPPIRYAYRGLGELMVGLNMGPIMVSGTYLAMSGTISYASLLLSLPIGISVAFILFYQSLSDMIVDKNSKKYTLAVRLGRHRIKSMVNVFTALIYASFSILLYFSILNTYSLISIIAFIFIFRIKNLLDPALDWTYLHEKGKYARFFYIIIGLSVLVGM